MERLAPSVVHSGCRRPLPRPYRAYPRREPRRADGDQARQAHDRVRRNADAGRSPPPARRARALPTRRKDDGRADPVSHGTQQGSDQEGMIMTLEEEIAEGMFTLETVHYLGDLARR